MTRNLPATAHGKIVLPNLLAKLVLLIRFYEEYIRSLCELNAMADHELADLGLTRSQLNETAFAEARLRIAG